MQDRDDAGELEMAHAEPENEQPEESPKEQEQVKESQEPKAFSGGVMVGAFVSTLLGLVLWNLDSDMLGVGIHQSSFLQSLVLVLIGMPILVLLLRATKATVVGRDGLRLGIFKFAFAVAGAGGISGLGMALFPFAYTPAKVPAEIDRNILTFEQHHLGFVDYVDGFFVRPLDANTLDVYCKDAAARSDVDPKDVPRVGHIEFEGRSLTGRFVPSEYRLEVDSLEIEQLSEACQERVDSSVSGGLSRWVRFQLDGSLEPACVPPTKRDAIRRSFCGARGKMNGLIATWDQEEGVFRCSSRPSITKREFAEVLEEWHGTNDVLTLGATSMSLLRRYEALAASLQEIYENMVFEHGKGEQHRLSLGLLQAYYDGHVPELGRKGIKGRARSLALLGAIARLALQYENTGNLDEFIESLTQNFRSYVRAEFKKGDGRIPDKTILRLYVRFLLEFQKYLEPSQATRLEVAIQEAVEKFDVEGIAGYLEDTLRARVYAEQRELPERAGNLREKTEFFCHRAEKFEGNGFERFQIALNNAQRNRAEEGQAPMPPTDVAQKISQAAEGLDKKELSPTAALDTVLVSVLGSGCEGLELDQSPEVLATVAEQEPEVQEPRIQEAQIEEPVSPPEPGADTPQSSDSPVLRPAAVEPGRLFSGPWIENLGRLDTASILGHNREHPHDRRPAPAPHANPAP